MNQPARQGHEYSPRVLILGHGEHGKDVTAELLRDHHGLSFQSSSRAAFEEAIWPVIGLEYLPLAYQNENAAVPDPIWNAAKEACFEDRRNRRVEWRDLISAFNTPDKARLVKLVLAQNDMYVGLRCDQEYAASRHLFDLIIWVHRPSYPVDSSMRIEFDPSCMHSVVNAGSKDLLRSQLRKIVCP